jgi:predicted amidohydrolase
MAEIKGLLFQFSPLIQEVALNIERARAALLPRYINQSLDFLAFPELGFTGYCLGDK